jgi:hypothetical protein
MKYPVHEAKGDYSTGAETFGPGESPSFTLPWTSSICLPVSRPWLIYLAEVPVC